MIKNVCETIGCFRIPEKINNIPGYEYLCRRCHMQKDGRLEKLHNLVKQSAPPKIRRICPTCYSPILLEPYRLRSKRNFCNKHCRAEFYYQKSGAFIKLNG